MAAWMLRKCGLWPMPPAAASATSLSCCQAGMNKLLNNIDSVSILGGYELVFGREAGACGLRS